MSNKDSTSKIRSTPDKSRHRKLQKRSSLTVSPNPGVQTRNQRLKHLRQLRPPPHICFRCLFASQNVEEFRDHCCIIESKSKDVIESKSKIVIAVDDDDDDEEEKEDDDEEEEFDEEKFHKEAWSEGGIYERQARVFAEASLSYLDDTLGDGKKYELVKLGSSSAASTFCGPLIHANFEAKAKDCPGAPVETFFAQLRQHRVLDVDCCVSLGPSDDLPYWENADLHGCKYCHYPIHHPAGNCEKLIKTRHDDVSWLYGDESDDDDDNVSSSSESD